MQTELEYTARFPEWLYEPFIWDTKEASVQIFSLTNRSWRAPVPQRVSLRLGFSLFQLGPEFFYRRLFLEDIIQYLNTSSGWGPRARSRSSRHILKSSNSPNHTGTINYNRKSENLHRYKLSGKVMDNKTHRLREGYYLSLPLDWDICNLPPPKKGRG